jgi:ABC-type dipeptide/oligopeptide/nickel transport system permease component
MGSYIFRRLVYVVIVFFAVAIITFGVMHAVPGGPFDSDLSLPHEVIEKLEARYHLDDPLPKQFLNYLNEIFIPKFSTEPPSGDVEEDALLRFQVASLHVRWFNFGPSFSQRTRTVNDIFRDNLPVSIQLGIMAFIAAIVIGIPSGIIAALNQNSVLDYASMSFAIMGVSIPAIVSGPLLVWMFGVALKILPPTGWGSNPPFRLGFLPTDLSWEGYWQYAVMPVLVLGFASAATVARLTRASMLQVIREDYIRTARAKGLSERVVVIRHALKNSLIPVVTILGPLFATLITGMFVVETVFGIPGMGRYFVLSINNRDYPVIMGTILAYAVLLVLSNLAVDIFYGYLDPRISYAEGNE